MTNKKLKQIWNKLNLCDFYLRQISKIVFCVLSDFYFDLYIGFSIAVCIMKKYWHVNTIEYNQVTL
jgi:hypothetical protein